MLPPPIKEAMLLTGILNVRFSVLFLRYAHLEVLLVLDKSHRFLVDLHLGVKVVDGFE